NIVQAINYKSDLLPNKYEGGFKVWECTIDLLQYFIKNEISFTGKSVLDLGCGAGFLGVYALLNGATDVHFQDYNEEVLKRLTIPNIAINLPKSSNAAHGVRCFAGSWSRMAEKVTTQYDVIVSSETIYCKKYYESLHRILKDFLKPEGMCLLAAKTYYFGVGGGVREFERFVGSMDVLKFKTFPVFNEGAKFILWHSITFIHRCLLFF
ncbi:hypothetical protein HELRODRAFT_90686, partial [Helobdella robusta]|uniref:protein-histidine N-methyltransferase n=1 Tax=Helobdella robusta TaxID=6412 RepID=T1G7U5_HELRO